MCRLALLAASLCACEPRGDAPTIEVRDDPALEVPRASPDRDPRSLPSGADPNDAMVLHFIDIGQGDATLLEFPCGAALIDTGGEKNELFDGEAALIAYLDAFFARRTDLDRTLDLLLVTHPHIDHNRAALTVLERYSVKNVVDNGADAPHHHDDGTPDPGATQQMAVHAWLKEHPDRARYLPLRAADVPPEGLTSPIIDPIGACARAPTDPRLTALWGQVTEDLATYGENPNNHSVVVRVDYGEASALFTGDLELIGLSRLADRYERSPELLDVDVYQVGHHGSKNATIHYQMALMSPRVAVISMGPYERNVPWTARKYGHPHIVAMEHLVHPRYGVRGRRDPIEAWIGFRGAYKDKVTEIFQRRTVEHAVYATGWDGTVVLTAHSSGYLDTRALGRAAQTAP